MKNFIKNGHCSIIVDKEIDKANGILEFKNITKNPRHYIVYFVHNITLKREIILYIVKLRSQKGYCIELHVKHPFLSSYLSNLGIEHQRDFSLFETKKSSLKRFEVVMLGGSAGSTQKILEILMQLPKNDTSFIIVQHIQASPKLSFDTLIEHKTPHKASYITKEETAILPGHIYIAPPGFQCLVQSKKLYLQKQGLYNYSEPSIDITLESLSQTYKQRLCAVLLCGYGSDGTTKLKSVAANGATLIAIKPSACANPSSIPQKAIASGVMHHIMDTPKIISYLQKHLHTTHVKINNIQEFLEAIYNVYGHDYKNYEFKSIVRNIDIAMKKYGYEEYEHFFQEVLSDKLVFSKLFFELSITVTRFLRYPSSYIFFQEHILPYLQSYGHLKIWSAGVSSGEEAYTIASLLHEEQMLNRSIIYATDVNPYVLQIAKNGLYSHKKVMQVAFKTAEQTKNFQSHFAQHGTVAAISEAMMRNIHYFTHNLVTDSSLGEFQVIFCQNVLIYFNISLQERVLQLFYDSLCIDGFLLLGDKEALYTNKARKLFKPLNTHEKIYQKVL